MAKAKSHEEPTATETKDGEKAPARRKCGLIMPISGTPELPESHWREVKAIITSALGTDFDVSLVSDSEGGDIIHRRIVHSLYTHEICICDISTLNPNVLFELGIRLTFDKPTVIIRDELTKAPFDVTLIRYLSYPRDLRYRKITKFKRDLKQCVEGTLEGYRVGDKSYSFMKMVGNIEIPDVTTEKVPAIELLSRRLDELSNAVAEVGRSVSGKSVVGPISSAPVYGGVLSRSFHAVLRDFVSDRPQWGNILSAWKEHSPPIRRMYIDALRDEMRSEWRVSVPFDSLFAAVEKIYGQESV